EIKEIENRMATSEGSSDRELYEQYQLLKEQLNKVLEEWEQWSIALSNQCCPLNS
ncbi:hypothetical protein EZS27_032366, partial [termite gut metagenome]